MAQRQAKRIRQPAKGYKAPETAAWKAGTPVALADIKVDDLLVCNVAGGVFCTVVSVDAPKVLVKLANGQQAEMYPASLRRPPSA